MSTADQEREPVGSVAEEAVKLIAALRERAGAADDADPAGAAHDHAAAGADSGTPEACAWCPLCQAIAYVRRTDPEVAATLVSSATTFLTALRDLADQAGRRPAEDAARASEAADRVQHIDLDEDAGPADAGSAEAAEEEADRWA